MFLFINGETDAEMAKRNAQDLSASQLQRQELELHAQGFTHKFLEGKDELFPQMVLRCLFWSRSSVVKETWPLPEHPEVTGRQ